MVRILHCLIFAVFALLLCQSLPAQALQARLSYTDPIIGERCSHFRSFVGYDIEYNFSDDPTSQFYVGLGFTYFRPKSGTFRTIDQYGANAVVTYGKVPMIPLRFGIRGALFPDAKVTPSLGMSFGYYYAYFDENTSSSVGQGGETLIGGMVGGAPEIGILWANDKDITFGVTARTHFMGSIESALFWSYFDIGFQTAFYLY